MLEGQKEIEMKTPYGEPSDKIKVCEYKGGKIALLQRHGPKHDIPPHGINNRANIFALKRLGVERIIGTAAVGSLKKEYERGDVVFPDQLIDFGKEVITYYDGPEVRHIAFADPFCQEIRAKLMETAKALGIKFHDKGTYIRVSGPRFSTRAESRMFREFGDIIGMTCIPEAVLSRELGICYAVIATVTDYDVWADETVNAEKVVKTMKENVKKTEMIIKGVLPIIPKERACECREAPEKGKF
ncbi:MAG: S-methyl-5'-thioadenosine phosphorylase [Candidatus Aenigmarchaeota archaeon]|nr:S-methyl-5'-thioadenosine phosphorylase [Candidatus Aenigmarchaeota archaeon]NIQ17762.1 S-methyl-5'-thioadenosine phosphorylase [Candidatus Aenigmarchaeota archaeon]NIS73082.1 S-methyl-5'-thioadenosine phosphorylase [Candidatus Aenigmarchaeota archaeon]